MNQTFKITEKKARCLNLESYEKKVIPIPG